MNYYNFQTSQNMKTQFEETMGSSIGGISVIANPPGQHFKFSSAAERLINTKVASLTSQQCRVLLWIYGELKGEKQTIVCFYRRISGDLEITKKAVQSAVASLKKKNMLLDLGVACSLRNPRQAIGKRFLIPHDVNIMLEFQLEDVRM